ncbi:hypothetical protein [Dactylosporangium matsuzakiense]|uniref:Uncharacterized protein n=1 Tax=Dactylosporangium matsuzakiense TaxID=53360 RepID=A0A9W6KJ42_9ACTN|nr:hypothetical protein [Dactylosporangium matsuzakiense]UWZ48850.1 hypothetical protein Dmats_22080 [Dactylosporangium matsuzakiense]GLL01040.1 hypothetical protein GCM10017581_027810 [Dactylosporangium matsuzakiense]
MIDNSVWYAACRRVVTFAVLFAVMAVIAALYVQILAGRPAELVARSVVVFGLAISLIGLGATLGVLITVVFWGVQAVRLANRHGAPGMGPLGFWGAGGFVLLFGLSFLVSASPPAFGAIRVLAAAVLVAAIRYDRSWYAARIGAEQPYSMVTGGDVRSPVAAQPTADDWNAGLWDPDVQRDIERRRNRPAD